MSPRSPFCSERCRDESKGDWRARLSVQRKAEYAATSERPKRKQVWNEDRSRRICSRCDRWLAAKQFPKNQSQCVSCRKLTAVEGRLRRVYGMTLEQYQAILESQGGVCYICQRPSLKNMLAVDHDHATGMVRGLLCRSCNHRLIGSAGDDIETLRRAVAYLENPPATDWNIFVPEG